MGHMDWNKDVADIQTAEIMSCLLMGHDLSFQSAHKKMTMLELKRSNMVTFIKCADTVPLSRKNLHIKTFKFFQVTFK